MIINAKSGARGELYDLLTGKEIIKPFWANLETGEYKSYKCGVDGKVLRDENKKPIIIVGRTKLFWKLVGSNLEIPREPTESLNNKKKHTKITPTFGRNCEHYGCIRLAEFAVGDEELIDPEEKDGVKYEKGKIIKRSYYCSWHYQPPKMFDHKGELISTWDEAGGVRPE